MTKWETGDVVYDIKKGIKVTIMECGLFSSKCMYWDWIVNRPVESTIENLNLMSVEDWTREIRIIKIRQIFDESL